MENKKIFNAQLKLSKLAEKEQRAYKDAQGNIVYTRPLLAGAYTYKGTTHISNAFWFVAYNSKIDGLVEIKNDNTIEDKDKPNLDQLIPNEYNNILQQFDINEQKTRLKDNKHSLIKFGEYSYQLGYVIDIYNSLIDCKIYTNTKNMYLILKGDNGIAIICPIRKGTEKDYENRYKEI